MVTRSCPAALETHDGGQGGACVRVTSTSSSGEVTTTAIETVTLRVTATAKVRLTVTITRSVTIVISAIPRKRNVVDSHKVG